MDGGGRWPCFASRPSRARHCATPGRTLSCWKGRPSTGSTPTVTSTPPWTRSCCVRPHFRPGAHDFEAKVYATLQGRRRTERDRLRGRKLLWPTSRLTTAGNTCAAKRRPSGVRESNTTAPRSWNCAAKAESTATVWANWSHLRTFACSPMRKSSRLAGDGGGRGSRRMIVTQRTVGEDTAMHSGDRADDVGLLDRRTPTRLEQAWQFHLSEPPAVLRLRRRRLQLCPLEGRHQRLLQETGVRLCSGR